MALNYVSGQATEAEGQASVSFPPSHHQDEKIATNILVYKASQTLRFCFTASSSQVPATRAAWERQDCKRVLF